MQRSRLTLLTAVTLATVLLCACTNDSGSSSSATASKSTPAGASGTPENTAVMGAVGDVALGHAVFTTNCATCHGPTGTEGGVGPSLRNERVRKDYDATIAWIKNPQPPMPKLYPSPLNDKEVEDAAAYVQSL